MNGISERTWVEIDRKALLHNVNEVAKVINPLTKIMSVVKSNAYGHGMVETAKTLAKTVDFFGVDSIEEATGLRKAKIKNDILILGWVPKEKFAIAKKIDAALMISNTTSLRDAIKFGQKMKIHIKLDTGMCRQGFVPDEWDSLRKTLTKAVADKKIILEGVYTHLSASGMKKFAAHTKKQVALFESQIAALRKINPDILAHVNNSGGSITKDTPDYDMIRVGIAQYGLWPDAEIAQRAKKINLKPALTWNAKISEVKKIKKGSVIGYNCTEKAPRDMTIGILPVGYWHGLPRSASSKAEFLVSGKPAKILGRVSMDITILDLSKIKNARQGSLVTLIGQQRKTEASAEKLAAAADTIDYEIVTRINSEIPRIYR